MAFCDSVKAIVYRKMRAIILLSEFDSYYRNTLK